MSRTALPLCAYCGNDLERQSRIIVEFARMRTVPRVAWHTSCAVADVLYRAMPCGSAKDAVLFLAAIDKRGARRMETSRYVRHSDM